MKYNIYGLLLDVNAENDTVRDFFESKFSSFGYDLKPCAEIVKTVSVSEQKDLEFFRTLDNGEKTVCASENALAYMIADGRDYSVKKICNSYVAWNGSNCRFYLADGESHILTVVCGYLLKQVVNALCVGPVIYMISIAMEPINVTQS